MPSRRIVALFVVALGSIGCDETLDQRYRERKDLVASGAVPTLVNLVPVGATDIQLCSDADAGALWGTYELTNAADFQALAVSPIAASSLAGLYTGSPGRLSWWPGWWRRAVSVETLSSSGLNFFQATSGDSGSISVVAHDRGGARVYLWIRRDESKSHVSQAPTSDPSPNLSW